MVGIREILSWHPDPAKRRTPGNERFSNVKWRSNLAIGATATSSAVAGSVCFQVAAELASNGRDRRVADREFWEASKYMKPKNQPQKFACGGAMFDRTEAVPEELGAMRALPSWRASPAGKIRRVR